MRVKLQDGIYVSVKESAKFQTNILACHFFGDLTQATYTEMTMLSRVLAHGCQRYPHSEQLSLALATLFGANLQVDSHPIGQWQHLSFRLSFVEPAHDQTNLKACIELLNQVVNATLFEDDDWGAHAFSIEKQALRSELLDLQSDNDLQAFQLTKQAFFQQDGQIRQLGQSVVGDLEALANLTWERLKTLYYQIQQDWQLEITVLADTEQLDWPELIAQYLDNTPRQPKKSLALKAFSASRSLQLVDRMITGEQSRLCMAYQLQARTTQKEIDCFALLTRLLGQNEQSLLFQEIREKRGLVYDISASFNPLLGWIVIEAGLSLESLTEVKATISQLLTLIDETSISADQLALQQLGLIDQRRLSADYADQVSDQLLTEFLYGQPRRSNAAYEQAIRSITLQDLSQSVRQLALTVVTQLKGVPVS